MTSTTPLAATGNTLPGANGTTTRIAALEQQLQSIQQQMAKVTADKQLSDKDRTTRLKALEQQRQAIEAQLAEARAQERKKPARSTGTAPDPSANVAKPGQNPGGIIDLKA